MTWKELLAKDTLVGRILMFQENGGLTVLGPITKVDIVLNDIKFYVGWVVEKIHGVRVDLKLLDKGETIICSGREEAIISLPEVKRDRSITFRANYSGRAKIYPPECRIDLYDE